MPHACGDTTHAVPVRRLQPTPVREQAPHREVDVLTADLTALEALGVAVRREMDAAAAYHDLAGHCAGSLARDRFLLLEQEARRHEALLRRQYADMASGAELRLPRASLAPAPEAGQVEEGAGIRGAVRCAADAEARARVFYLDAAAAAEDPAAREMLRYLADVHARRHMELESEYELVVRYPHAYDDQAAPWRPEVRMADQ
jgi:rubrerythrin